MRTALTENSEILLQEIGTQKPFRFKILETVGMGASCIVYTAVYEDAEKNQIFVRLKECYPAGVEISRNQKQELVISDTESFQKELQHFTDGYQNQLKFRTIPESMNSISNIQGIYQGNHTKYIAMSCQNGISLKQEDLNRLKCYEHDGWKPLKITETDLHEIFNGHYAGFETPDVAKKQVSLDMSYYNWTPPVLLEDENDDDTGVRCSSPLVYGDENPIYGMEIYVPSRPGVDIDIIRQLVGNLVVSQILSILTIPISLC